MSQFRWLQTTVVLILFAVLTVVSAGPQEINTVFVIAMENHNWAQPASIPGGPQQIYGNPNATFINSLVNGAAVAANV